MFHALSIAMALQCLFLSYVTAFAPSRFLRLPRNKWVGAAIGAACLAWSSWYGCMMLEGGLARFRFIVVLLVPVTAILALLFLDYLYARAIGGFFVLASNELIRQAFAADIMLRPFFSLLCLAMGICGLFMLGMPWRMRDAIALSASRPAAGRAIGAVFAVSGIAFAALPFFRR